jgi:uncharacterized membrane protein YkoI
LENLFILTFVFTFISFPAFSQKNPSEIIKKQFSKKYATAKSVNWDNEEKNEWEAEFTVDGKKMLASFDNSRKWIESETSITEKELTASVAGTLNKDFSGYRKTLIEIYESPEIKGFELGLKKGKTSIEVIFDNNGNILKKTDAK